MRAAQRRDGGWDERHLERERVAPRVAHEAPQPLQPVQAVVLRTGDTPHRGGRVLPRQRGQAARAAREQRADQQRQVGRLRAAQGRQDALDGDVDPVVP